MYFLYSRTPKNTHRCLETKKGREESMCTLNAKHPLAKIDRCVTINVSKKIYIY